MAVQHMKSTKELSQMVTAAKERQNAADRLTEALKTLGYDPALDRELDAKIEAGLKKEKHVTDNDPED